MVEKNLQIAIRNYETAQADGHIDSLNALGSLFYVDLKEYDQAFEWFKKAAEKGHTRAINNLGICYEKGHGTDRDWDIAQRLYTESAQKGSIQAMYNLGYLFFQLGHQNNKTSNFEKAAHWFRVVCSKLESDQEIEYDINPNQGLSR